MLRSAFVQKIVLPAFHMMRIGYELCQSGLKSDLQWTFKTETFPMNIWIQEMLRRFLSSWIVLLGLPMISHPVLAQCVNTIQQSCAVYDKCFSKYCPCSGSTDEYFQSYGRKYCGRFLASTGWSAAGQRWRDKTLLCLQEKIVPKLNISNNPSCDCKAMKEFAYKAHVDCYTQKKASICSLDYSDFKKISDIIDVKDDLFGNSYGRAQMREVLEICRRDPNSTVPPVVLDLILTIIKKLS